LLEDEDLVSDPLAGGGIGPDAPVAAAPDPGGFVSLEPPSGATSFTAASGEVLKLAVTYRGSLAVANHRKAHVEVRPGARTSHGASTFRGFDRHASGTHAPPASSVPCCPVLCGAVLCCPVLSCAVPCCPVLSRAGLYSVPCVPCCVQSERRHRHHPHHPWASLPLTSVRLELCACSCSRPPRPRLGSPGDACAWWTGPETLASTSTGSRQTSRWSSSLTATATARSRGSRRRRSWDATCPRSRA
jgi:hypothetical protein